VETNLNWKGLTPTNPFKYSPSGVETNLNWKGLTPHLYSSKIGDYGGN